MRTKKLLVLVFVTVLIISLTLQSSAFAARQTLIPDNEVPVAYGTDSAYEIGMVFGAKVDGQIVGVRIYAVEEEGLRKVRFWSPEGELLHGPFNWDLKLTDYTAAGGWAEFELPTPFNITADTEYIVSVSNGPDLKYSATLWYFEEEPLESGDLYAPIGAGRYAQEWDVFPEFTWGAILYFRDVIFVAGDGSADPTPAGPTPADPTAPAQNPTTGDASILPFILMAGVAALGGKSLIRKKR